MVLCSNRQCPESVPNDVRAALKGIVVKIKKHKTSKNGPVLVWLTPIDQILIKCYIIVARNFAKAKGKTYDVDKPMFINRNCDTFKHRRRTVNYSLLCQVCNIRPLGSHAFRKMFATYYGSNPELTIREAAAMASNHR